MLRESNEEKLKSSIFFIEANSYEQLALWKEYSNEVDWEEDSSGVLYEIGTLGKGKPVCVCFSFAKLNGKRVCFYYATSRYVDNTMIEKYIQKNYPVKWDDGTRCAMTDAMNFHHALSVVR